MLTKIFNFISNNGLVSTLIATTLVAIAVWIRKCWIDRRDGNKIYNFMLTSKSKTDFKFRTTEAISSDIKISESRVAELCSKHPKIKRNEKEKQSWQLVE